jgi:hypothetical protein
VRRLLILKARIFVANKRLRCTGALLSLRINAPILALSKRKRARTAGEREAHRERRALALAFRLALALLARFALALRLALARFARLALARLARLALVLRDFVLLPRPQR